MRETPNEDTRVRVGEVARWFGCGERHVQKLAREGVIPRARRGEYDLAECVRRYIEQLREEAAGRADAPGERGLASERARLASAQALKIERENAVAAGKLVDAEVMAAAAVAVDTAIRTRLLAVPVRVSHDVAASTSPTECLGIVEEAITEALTDVAAMAEEGS